MSDEDEPFDREWLSDELPSLSLDDVSAALGGEGLVTHWVLMAKIVGEDEMTSTAYRVSDGCDVVTQVGLLYAVQKMMDSRL